MMDDEHGFLTSLFDPQTYRNILYLGLSFPAGLLYFLLLTIGLSLGVGLSFILIGIPIVLATMLASQWAADVERALSNSLLGTDIPLASNSTLREMHGLGGMVKAAMRGSSWKALIYIGLKFPLGLMTFVILSVVGGLVGSFLIAPFSISNGVSFTIMDWSINTMQEGFFVMLFGLVLLPFALRLFSAMGDMWRRINEALLDDAELYEVSISKRKAVLYGESRSDDYDDDPFDDYGYTDEKPKRSLANLLDDNYSTARR